MITDIVKDTFTKHVPLTQSPLLNPPRNILIVTEMWALGGLESRIETFINDLPKKTRVIMLVGSHCIRENIPSKITKLIHTTFFKPTSTVSELAKEIAFIDSIIREYHIDLVIAHPFLSIPPTILASKKNAIPCVTVLHGVGSLSAYGETHRFLLELSLHLADAIEVVSEKTQYLLSHFLQQDKPLNKSFIERQKISYTLFPEKTQTENKKICLFTRMDDDKIPTILHLIHMIKHIEHELHIYGNGSREEQIRNLIEEEKIQNIYLHPSMPNHKIASEIADFHIVAGLGRALLEGVVCNKPSLLIGADGIKGFLDKELFQKAKRTNFSGVDILSITEEELFNQLNTLYENPEKYLLRDYVAEEINAAGHTTLYFKKIHDILQNKNGNDYFNQHLLETFYDFLQHLNYYQSKTPWITHPNFLLLCNKIFKKDSSHLSSNVDLEYHIIEGLKKQVDEEKAINHYVLSSASWKVTTPLRKAFSKLKHLRYFLQTIKCNGIVAGTKILIRRAL